MYNVEFKVKPVTRYIVTKYSKGVEETGVVNCGEFDNYKKANIVCESLFKTHSLEMEELDVNPRTISCEIFTPEYF